MIDFDRAIRFPDLTRYGQCFEYMFVFSKGRPKAINLLTEPNKTAGDRGRNTKSQREPDGSLTMKPRIPVHDVQVLRNVWEISSGYMKSTADKIAYEHPAIMDERIAERHILTWSNPGDLVLDFFTGSGTTLKMARMCGRDYLGSELNADYIAIASDRLRLPFEARRMIHNGDVSDLPLFAARPA
jgi:DNA modification methylase